MADSFSESDFFRLLEKKGMCGPGECIKDWISFKASDPMDEEEMELWSPGILTPARGCEEAWKEERKQTEP